MKFSAFVLAHLALLALPCNAYLGAESEEESDERRVWVKYKDGERDAALRSMSSFMARSMAPVKVHYDFTRIGAFVVTATVDEINELSVDPMIDEIVEDVKRYPMHIPESMEPRELQGETVPYGITMGECGVKQLRNTHFCCTFLTFYHTRSTVQAADAHALGYTGQGARVCVVDTVSSSCFVHRAGFAVLSKLPRFFLWDFRESTETTKVRGERSYAHE